MGITYGRLSSRPRTLGRWNLGYDRFGNNLTDIGGLGITYYRLGNRPRTFGQWTLEYDHLGSRLRRIGPYELGSDWHGNRLRTLGPLILHYGRFGNRPSQVEISDEYGSLPDDLLLALFLVLHMEAVEKERAGRRSIAGA
ncbi:hypothetical protein PUR71_05565 [Streptomyces sp. SP17BM10]|uniref:hypothetical protein n=1 Tax=Streptomyces sp. SP17BM10 TaxID=3002530 RepID=UPI002E7A837A|nr:hypothetical protein [Streptomyces sp. SP17BM10]MEE1782396.1 hypothetical protein [Streptomyces sp. SP17BM10]